MGRGEGKVSKYSDVDIDNTIWKFTKALHHFYLSLVKHTVLGRFCLIVISRVNKPVLEPKNISIVWFKKINSNWRECVINVDKPVEVGCQVLFHTAYGCDVMTKAWVCYVLKQITRILLSCQLEELKGCCSLCGIDVQCWYHILICKISKTELNGDWNLNLSKQK